MRSNDGHSMHLAYRSNCAGSYQFSVKLCMHKISALKVVFNLFRTIFRVPTKFNGLFLELTCLARDLSNDDNNGNENVTRKFAFISFVLLRDYFKSYNFYKNGELSRNKIGRSGIQVKKRK